MTSGLNKLISQKKVQMPDDKAEMYFKPKINPIGMPPTMRCISKPTPPVMIPPQKFQQLGSDDPFYRTMQQYNEQCYRNNPFAMGSNDVTISTTMPTEFMNQMMNCSYQQQPQQQQPRFHPNPFDDAPAPNQSFYERNLKFQNQQQLQSLKRDFYNSSGMSTGGSCSSSLSAYEANMQQQYSMMTPSSSCYNRFDPPKPDTPPSSKPLWLDPVWNCDGNFFGNRNNGGSNGASNGGSNSAGNYGNSDSVKAFNFHVVSPFLSFKTMFTFDNMGQGAGAGNSNNQKI